MQRILHWIASTTAQVERAQIRIDFLVVGHRRHNAMLQNLDGNHVFDPCSHGVSGETLGVADNDIVGGFTESLA